MILANCTGPDFIEVRSLNGSGLGRVFDSGTGCFELGNGFRRALVTTFGTKVMMLAMLSRLHPFKVIRPVVGFVAVDVMNVFSSCRIINPAGSNNTMHQSLPAYSKVAITAFTRGVWEKISKNFSALRNGVQVVEESKLDSVNLNAQHSGLRFVSGNQIVAFF